jgi:ribosomal protein L6P/L9E
MLRRFMEALCLVHVIVSYMDKHVIDTAYNTLNLICYAEYNAMFVCGRYGIKKAKIDENTTTHVSNGFVRMSCAAFTRRISALSLSTSLFSSNAWGTVLGYYTKYRMKGLGHRIYQRVNTFIYKLGYSHTVYKILGFNLINSPKRFKKQYYVAVRGTDQQMVSDAARTIQSYRIPNCYCFNGIFIRGFYVEPKEGKKGFML